MRLRRMLVKILVATLLAAPLLALLDYFLPRHDVVRMVGTEVRRTAPDSGGRTQDVYLIFAERPDTGRPMVFENEDTGWGFPFYFKFDAADVQARAASIGGRRETALITFYGWRIPLLSMFPNTLSVREVAPDHVPIPWFRIVFFAAIVGVALFLWRSTARFMKARRRPAPYTTGLE